MLKCCKSKKANTTYTDERFDSRVFSQYLLLNIVTANKYLFSKLRQ